MGQRHQIYVIIKDKNEYEAIGAFHHQWCYGLTAATNLISTVQLASKVIARSAYLLLDAREIRTLVTAMYGVNERDASISIVHDESEYLIEDGAAFPDRGDNNDGCGLIIIDRDSKTARGCLFAFSGVEGNKRKAKNWSPMTPKQYAALYYTDAELLEFDNKEMLNVLNAEIKPVTPKEFKSIFKKSIKGIK